MLWQPLHQRKASCECSHTHSKNSILHVSHGQLDARYVSFESYLYVYSHVTCQVRVAPYWRLSPLRPAARTHVQEAALQTMHCVSRCSSVPRFGLHHPRQCAHQCGEAGVRRGTSSLHAWCHLDERVPRGHMGQHSGRPTLHRVLWRDGAESPGGRALWQCWRRGVSVSVERPRWRTHCVRELGLEQLQR